MTMTQGNIVRESTFEQDWEQWHAAREFALTTEHGWLTLTAFHWLPPQPGPLAGLPGSWSSSDVGATHQQDGQEPITAQVAEAGSLDWFELDGALVELIRRGGRYAIRLRDPKAARRTGFTGVPAFPADPRWVVPGRFTAFDADRPVTVETARDDLRQQITLIGAVTVELDGQVFPLLAGAGSNGTLSIIFHDATNGASTARWRVVGTSAPDQGGRLTVDFNRAVNLPFAFSDYGTCPAPPAGNRLTVEITAGEKLPR